MRFMPGFAVLFLFALFLVFLVNITCRFISIESKWMALGGTACSALRAPEPETEAISSLQ